MSEWNVVAVRIDKIGKHPNADNLSITQIHGGYPVIFRTDNGYNPGDLLVYIPVDSVVPDTEEFHFLCPLVQPNPDDPARVPQYPVGQVPEKYRRIKAKKLRGIFSMGMLMPALPNMEPGQLVHDMMGITKYEPPEEGSSGTKGLAEKGPEGWEFIKYTDIEGLRKYKRVLELGEEVVITEKCHGTNARMCHDGARLWCGSHNVIKAEDYGNFWWQAARDLNLAERLAQFPKVIFFGEIIGKGVQKLTYDRPTKELIIFDTFDVTRGRWNDWDTTVELASHISLKTVPVLYRGPWKGEEQWPLAEGKSTLASHIREGFVVKPAKERWVHTCGRVIFKLIGEQYLLTK